jgi:transcriptional regulator with XRE-family HTH domain
VTALKGMRRLRRERELSGEVMGAAIGVNKSHYGKLESGKVRLDIHRAKILADKLGVQIEALL